MPQPALHASRFEAAVGETQTQDSDDPDEDPCCFEMGDSRQRWERIQQTPSHP